MFNLKVFLEFVLISADDSGATEAVAECRILLAQSPDLVHHLSPADHSTLHHVPLPPTHMTIHQHLPAYLLHVPEIDSLVGKILLPST